MATRSEHPDPLPPRHQSHAEPHQPFPPHQPLTPHQPLAAHPPLASHQPLTPHQRPRPKDHETSPDDTLPQAGSRAGELDDLAAGEGETPSRTRRRWEVGPRWRKLRLRPRWVIATAAAGLLILWLLPTLVAYTPLFTWIVNRTAADLNGTVTVGSASLGWFSPIVLGDVAVRDQEDRPLAEIPKVCGDRSLLSVLMDTSRLGRFRLEEPKFTLVLRDDGSNLEDALAEYLNSEKPQEKVDVAVEIVDGSVAVEEARGKRSWQVEKFQLAARAPISRSKPVELEVSGVVPEGQRKGQFKVGLKVQQQRSASAKRSEESDDGEEQLGPDEVSLALDGIPLAMFETLLRRVVPGARISGRVATAIQGRWDSHQADGAIVLAGTVRGEALAWSCPALGRDTPALERLEVKGQAAWQGGRLRLDRCTVESDLGDLSVAGVLDLSASSAGDRLASILHQSMEVKGQLDLARLAAALPHTLRIRRGTQITAGKLQLAMSSRRRPEGMAWEGQLQTTNLMAKQGGQSLTWREPVTIALAARETPQGPAVDRLHCRSDFLTVYAAGTRDKFTATANFDLNQLARQSGGFLDLGGLQLAGRGSSNLAWTRSDQQTFAAKLTFQADQFKLAFPGRLTWFEEHVSADLSATGWTDFQSSRFDTALAHVEAGTVNTGLDTFQVRLMEPVTGLGRGRPLVLEVQSRGQLARWQPRISPWIDVSAWKLGGGYELLTEVSTSHDAIGLRRTQLSVTDLVASGPQLNLREPQVQLTLAGQWNSRGRRLELESAQLTSAGLVAQADRLVLAMPARGSVELDGTVQGEVALDRLQQWTTVGPPDPAQWRLQGRLSGITSFQRSGGIIAGQFDAVIVDLLATNSSGQRYHEGEIRLAGRASYNDLNRWLQVERLSLSSGTIRSTANGKVAKVNGQTELDLNGTIDYDLDRVSELLRTRYGNAIALSGRGSAPVSYRGPLGSDRAVAAASLNWERATLYGFQFGSGELRAQFSRGVVDIQPMSLEVNEGRLKLAPHVRISPEPKLLALEPGRAVDQVRITPAACAALLQYLAPLLAGVTQAEGRFSIDLDGCHVPLGGPADGQHVPLAGPADGEIAGKLTIHSIQVGPGPLIQQLAQLLGRPMTARLAREMVVPFRMTGRRVYHEQMELVFSDVTVRTKGSVGLDQTLSLLVEMPVPPQWQGNPAIAPLLRNQVIQLPVVGTLSQPRIDLRALEQVSRQSLQNAARNVIEDQFNRQLNRLMAPPPQPPPR